MMKKVVTMLLALGLLATWLALPALADETAHKVIGSVKCKMCHKGAKKGEQFEIWQGSSHAKAFETLASEAALAIAKEQGLGNPQEEPACLACHTTQHFLGEGFAPDAKTKYDIAEGIGCEACHGPGSEYKSNKVMKDAAAAKAAGLVMVGEDHCAKCHNEKSPTFKEFDFDARWAEIAHPKAAAE